MTTIDDISLSQPEAILSVASTPLFILRKLQEDAAARTIQKTFNSAVVLEAVKGAVGKKPETLKDVVRPYVYLIALSIYPNKDDFNKALLMSAPYHQWYAYIGEVLRETSRPTITAQFSGQYVVPRYSTSTTSANNVLIWPTDQRR